MSIVASSPFTIWQDWLNALLATTREQVESCAARHATMSGAASTSNVFWFRTGPNGKESGLFASMTHAGDIHSTSNVSELVNFLKSLPESAKKEIANSLS